MKNIFLSFIAAVGIGPASCSAQSDSIPVLPPQEFISKAHSDITSVILDVRTPEEFADGHIEGAVLLNFLDTEAFDKGIRLLDKSHTYYVYCRSGKRSHKACDKMQKQGIKVFDMEGGYLNWTKVAQ